MTGKEAFVCGTASGREGTAGEYGTEVFGIGKRVDGECDDRLYRGGVGPRGCRAEREAD